MPNSLLHSPSDIVRRALISLGVGTTPSASAAWPVFSTSEPNAPDNVVTVYDTVGISDGRSMIDGELQRHLGIQVRIRSADHATGWVKADQIQTALAEGLYQKTLQIGDSWYLVHCAGKVGDVLPLGRESPESRRLLFTVNALVSIRALT